MKFFKLLLPILIALTGSSCSHNPEYRKTVSKVDLMKFMKKWHVQAGRFTSFEKNPFNSVEAYTWNQEENRIDIDFSYNQGSLDGPLKKIPQIGWVKDTVNNSTWSVQPWWPLKFDYLIIGLGENYEWTAIGVPGQNFLWIMSSTPQFPREKVQEILKNLHDSGYNVDDIEYVEHGK